MQQRNWAIAMVASVAMHATAMVGVPEEWFAPSKLPPPSTLIARIVEAPSPAVEASAVPATPPVSPVRPTVPKPVAKPKHVEPAPISLPDPVAASPTAIEPEPAVVPAEESHPQNDALASAPVPTEPLPTESSPPAATPRREEAAPPPADTQAPAPSTAPPARVVSKYPLKSATIIYDLSYGANPMRVGRVTHTWSNDGERYFAETVIEATGVFALLYGGKYIQRSWGVLGPSGLVPTEFTVQRGRPDRGETAQFDWEAGRVDFAWRGEKRSAKLVGGTQDPISMLHQIFFMQPLPASRVFHVASSRKLGTYEYVFLGEEKLQTPLGDFQALHIRRKDDDADHVDVWLDPKRSFLPLRIHFVDRKGTVFDQRVREMHTQSADAAPGQAAVASQPAGAAEAR
jgi:Protein of unknown function (DUF3108)